MQGISPKNRRLAFEGAEGIAAYVNLHGNLMQILVECYAGYRGEETPRRIQIGNQRIAITEIIDRWLAPGHRYFKFRTADGAQWIIRHDSQTGQWELTFFRKG